MVSGKTGQKCRPTSLKKQFVPRPYLSTVVEQQKEFHGNACRIGEKVLITMGSDISELV
jgi:hypothetical protein